MEGKIIELISREIVKPSSSNNNNHPKIHTFSFFDQLSPCFYVPLLFFYKSTKNGESTDNRSSVLKHSLSEALSRYYPLAGRVKDGVIVDCNDEGVLFYEARTECSLSQLLNNPQSDKVLVKLLLPYGVSPKDSFRMGPLVVQVTYFQCGGMSLGIYVCHKMMDIASIASFIKDWASLARNSDAKISPEFNVGSLYPPLDLPFLKQNVEAPPDAKDCVSRRVVFDGSKIEKLKEMVADQVPNPTRVEVVSSVLFKSALTAKANKAISPGRIMSGFVNYAMNLRPRVSPPVSERKRGNLSAAFQVWAREDKELELGFLVKEIRKEKTRFSNSCANIKKREDLCGSIMKNTKELIDINMNAKHEMYTCTSWCRYPFYESDFGWGKPLQVATDFSNMKNVIVLIDTREGDGIEAFIRMEAKAMAVFEKDEELLSFSCINPSVFE